MHPQIIPRSAHSVSRKQINDDALKVLYRLRRHGKFAYLVGGGVRDLLLGVVPKDFDVATDAHPGEVKRLFRNSWIVGRRFRLVHVVFGKHVVEVATFRAQAEVTDAAPQATAGNQAAAAGAPDSSLLVTWENTFGTPEQDAKRRDFTINALFYDIATYSVIDYVGGLADLQDRVIRTIGDPDVRLQEDPVRMMRAVKFAARLGFRIEPRTYAGLVRHAGAISLSAAPRVLEEIFRLLGSAKAEDSFRLLSETGLLDHLLPEVAGGLRDGGSPAWSLLRELDSMVAAGEESVSRAVQMAVVLDPLVRPALDDSRPGAVENLAERIESIIRPVAQRLRMTRADTARMLQMYSAQRRFVVAKGRRFSVPAFVRRGYFGDSFQLFRLNAAARDTDQDQVRSWQQRILAVDSTAPSVSEPTAGMPRSGRRRRRGGRRRRSGQPSS